MAADAGGPIVGLPVTGWRAELLVGLAMVAISALFVGVRLSNHDFDPTVFILAGEEVTDPAVNPDMFIVEGAFGYDGQRYYRLSRNPFTSEVEEFGITFDRPAYWQKRIGYPFIVWLVSGFGRAEVVPWMMIAVNVVAVGVIGTVAARLARMHERSPWLGLIPAAWGGYVVAISQNLTEAVVGAFLIASLLALRRQRWALAAAGLVAAALTRETSLIFSVALLATSFSPLVRRLAAAKADDGSPARGPRVPVWVPAIPIATYVAWRAVINSRWVGAIEGGTESDALLAPPFVRLVEYLATVIRDPGAASIVNLAQLGLTIAAAALLTLAWRDRRSGLPHERLALALLLVLFVSLPVWQRGQAYLRWACEPVMIGWLVALGARSNRVHGLAVVVALLWTVTAVDLVTFPGLDLGVDRALSHLPLVGPGINAPVGVPSAGP